MHHILSTENEPKGTAAAKILSLSHFGNGYLICCCVKRELHRDKAWYFPNILVQSYMEFNVFIKFSYISFIKHAIIGFPCKLDLENYLFRYKIS
jgi:hypothetical protein